MLLSYTAEMLKYITNLIPKNVRGFVMLPLSTFGIVEVVLSSRSFFGIWYDRVIEKPHSDVNGTGYLKELR